MVDKDLFMSQITEETCAEAVEETAPGKCVDFQKYFEKRLNQFEFNSLIDYLDQQSLNHHSLEFQTTSLCYRLNIKDSILDFPSNWSIFEEISTKEIIPVDPSVDHNFLIDIFSELVGSVDNIVLLRDNQNIMLVFLQSTDSKDHLRWMYGYFEKKNDGQGIAA